MEEFLAYFSLANANDRYVLISVLLLGASSGMVGCFTFLRKRALVGDAVAHSILPGICLAFILTGTKNPIALLLGAIATGWLSLLAIDAITNHSKLKEDTAIGLVLSSFFGIGILLLTAIQNSGAGNQAGLDNFLFGETAWLTSQDMLTFGGLALLLVLIVIAFFKEFRLVSFNPEYAKVIGLPVRFFEFLLATITVLAVAVGIKAVGVVLMAALLITPAAAANFWTVTLSRMVLIAAFIGAISGVFGSYVSSVYSTPTAPWIVMALSFFAIGSILFAPQRGLLSRMRLQKQNQRKILVENILKVFYKLGEKEENFFEARELSAVRERRSFSDKELQKGLRLLQKQKLITTVENQHKLTFEGLESGKRIVKLHRLWELYLTTRMRMEPDHIHNNAEAIEHIITPEVEAMLEKELGYPDKDPHNSQIPYSKSLPDG